MVALNLIVRATAFAAIAAATFQNTAYNSTCPQNITLPVYKPPTYKDANFSDGNKILLENTDPTPRSIIFTQGSNQTLIPTLNLTGCQKYSQPIPNDWNGNFYSVNQGLIPVHFGILAEVTFGPVYNYFDISSIVNRNDTDGVKMLMPAISKSPAAGCISFVQACNNSYLYWNDDKNTRSTEEKELLCYIGNGMTAVPAASGTMVISSSAVSSTHVTIVPTTLTTSLVGSTTAGMTCPSPSGGSFATSSPLSPVASTTSSSIFLSPTVSTSVATTVPTTLSVPFTAASTSISVTPFMSISSVPPSTTVLATPSSNPTTYIFTTKTTTTTVIVSSKTETVTSGPACTPRSSKASRKRLRQDYLRQYRLHRGRF